MALSELEPDCLYLVQHQLHWHHSRAGLHQPKLCGLLHQVDRVLPSGGKRDDGCPALLSPKQK